MTHKNVIVSNVEFKGIKFASNETDPMWLKEAGKLQPWAFGKGADIGCGQRSINDKVIRVDVDENVKPDIKCNGQKLPFKDCELDYITSIHSFEHFDNQKEVLSEWLRCVKSGGIIGIVHPDVDFTKKQVAVTNPEEEAKNPYNHHYHETNLPGFLEKLKEWSDLLFIVLDSGPACPNWSFYVILQKL